MSKPQTPQSSVTPRVTVLAASPGQASAVSVTPRVNVGPSAKIQSSAPRTLLQPSYHSGGGGGAQYVVIQDSAVEPHMQEVMTDTAGGQTLVYHSGHAHSQYVGGMGDPLLYSQEMYDQWEKYNDYDAGMYSAYYPSQVGGMIGSMDGIQGHLQGGAYVLQGSMIDGEGGQVVAHTTRASPATVQWLIDNYEVAEGVSLPRNTLYNHYLRHCHDLKMDPMNPASFGKLIRSVFLGLRTRRLGTRGNSKYHYYGIRIKPQSVLNQYSEEGLPIRHGGGGGLQRRFKTMSSSVSDSQDGVSPSVTQEPMTPVAPQQVHQQFLGDATAAVPQFATIDIGDEPLPEGVTMDDIQLFGQLYKEHCKAILEVVVNLKFSQIENIWRTFWHGRTDLTPDSLASEEDLEQSMPQDTLFAMCSMNAFQQYVCRSDQAFYQAVVEVLIPDVLRPIPSSLTQAIRNFGKNLDTWLKNATLGVPEELVKAKMTAVVAFAQTLRRYTSLNHLAQAARAVLQNSAQISQMVADLNKVDFNNIQEQASWVCECEDTTVRQLEQDFKRTLQKQLTLEQWAVWLDSFVNRLLKPFVNSPHYTKAARQVLLKWSFYSSLVIRDLTLRSAASFGSFHLIRLLYDEYIFYLVEHKVALALNESPIAILNELRLVKDDDDDCLSPSSMLADLNEVSKASTVPTATLPAVLPSSGVAVGRVISVTMPQSAGFTGTTSTRTVPFGAKPGQGTVTGASNPNKTIIVMPISHGTNNSSNNSNVDSSPVTKKIKTG